MNFLGVDIGTSRCKAAIFDENGIQKYQSEMPSENVLSIIMDGESIAGVKVTLMDTGDHIPFISRLTNDVSG